MHDESGRMSKGRDLTRCAGCEKVGEVLYSHWTVMFCKDCQRVARRLDTGDDRLILEGREKVGRR